MHCVKVKKNKSLFELPIFKLSHPKKIYNIVNWIFDWMPKNNPKMLVFLDLIKSKKSNVKTEDCTIKTALKFQR